MTSAPASSLPLQHGLPALPVAAEAIGEPAGLAPPRTALQRRLERAPEWFCAFLAGNTREKTRFRSELATMKGSVVWLVRQRRIGAWTATEREHLRNVMRSASSVSPYLVIWVVPGSLLVLPFMAWFIDRRRRSKSQPLDATALSESATTREDHNV